MPKLLQLCSLVSVMTSFPGRFSQCDTKPGHLELKTEYKMLSRQSWTKYSQKTKQSKTKLGNCGGEIRGDMLADA